MQTPSTFTRALKWAYAMNWSQQALNLLFIFVLASILGPSEFGTVAIAVVYIGFIQMVLEQGLAAALIQRKNLKPEHLDSVFWMALMASFILAGLSLLLSSWWAAASNLPELSLIIAVLSISIPIKGLTIVQEALLHRQMDFKSLSVRFIISVLVGGSVGIGLALNNFGVWALVAQQLSRDLVALYLLWRLSHWRPRWRFSGDSAKDLLGFSTANFVAKFGMFVNDQADALFMGLFFGPSAVGLSRMAGRLMFSLQQGTTKALQTVSFPQFCRVQDNATELRKNVLTCIRASAIAAIVPLAVLAATSDLLMALMGEQWADAADALRILCLLGIVGASAQFTAPILQAVSRPKELALLLWVFAVVYSSMLVLVGTLLRDASTWTQVVWVAGIRFGTTALSAIPFLVWVLPRLCRISVKTLLVVLRPSYVAGVTAAAAVMLLRGSGALLSLGPIFYFFICVAVGGTAGIGMLFGLDTDLRRDAVAWAIRFLGRARAIPAMESAWRSRLPPPN